MDRNFQHRVWERSHTTEERRESILSTVYPRHKIVGVDALYVQKPDGTCLWYDTWYDTLIDNEEDALALARRGKDAFGRRILMMALILEAPDGTRRVADFRPSEIV